MMRLIFGYLLSTLLVSGGLSAYPFLNPLGQLSLYAKYQLYQTEHFWNDQGERREAFNHFTSQGVDLHAEYGLNQTNTLFGTIQYTKIDESLNGDTSGVNDMEFGWRRLFKQTPSYIVLGELTAIVPPAGYKSALRYGQFGGEASLQYTHYFHICEQYGFLGMRFGYRVYSGFPSDQLRSDLAVGWNFCDTVQLQAAGRLEYGLFNGHSRLDASNIAYNPNYRLFKTDLTAMIYLRRSFYAILGYSQHFWGRNVGIGATYYAGINGDF